MGNTSILRHDQILELHATVIAVGLAQHRNALLAGIDAAFMAGLSADGTLSTLILTDLAAMNAAGTLSDGSVPLLCWLQNAVALTGARPEAEIFGRALVQAQERTSRAPSPAIKPLLQPTAASGFLPQESNEAQPGGDAPIDFAILTALEVERRAVCAAFGLTDQDRIKRNGRVYWRGKLPIGDGAAYDLVIAQPAEMGQTEAAALATEVALVWRPWVVLMVGIAASTKPDEVKLGDVVVGRSVYYYEHGKITAEGIQPQPEMIPADANLLKHYTGLAGWNGAVLAPRPDGTDTGPRVFLGVIASGDKVVAHAAARDFIAAGQRKILALEMEGYGFSRALWLNPGRIRHLVIRGISDDGSEHKRDDWHHYAAASAAGFARHFLLDRPLEQDESITPAPSNGSAAGAGDLAGRAREAEFPNAGAGAGTHPKRSQAHRAPGKQANGPPLWATVSVFILGVLGFASLAALIQKAPCPSATQVFFIQVVISLSAAALGWAIPGFLSVTLNIPHAGKLRAGGALALLVMVFLVTPSQLQTGHACEAPTFATTIRFTSPTTPLTAGKARLFLGNEQRTFDIGPTGEIEVKSIDRRLLGTNLSLSLESPGFRLKGLQEGMASYALTGANLLEIPVEPVPAEFSDPQAQEPVGKHPHPRDGPQDRAPSPFPHLSYKAGTPEAFKRLIAGALKDSQAGAHALPCPVELRISPSSATLTVYGRCVCPRGSATELPVAVVASHGGVVPTGIGPIVVSGLREQAWKACP